MVSLLFPGYKSYFPFLIAIQAQAEVDDGYTTLTFASAPSAGWGTRKTS